MRWAGRFSGPKRPWNPSRPGLLRDYFQTAYVAPNLIVSAAGNVDHAQVRALISRAFAQLPSVLAPFADTVPQVVPPGADPHRRSSSRATSVSAPTATRRIIRDRYVSYILNTVLGGSMSSRLFQNVREKRGLAYAVFSGLSAYHDAGNVTIYAGLRQRGGPRSRSISASRSSAC